MPVAAFRDGKHALAFPSFGSERTGAPVVSFCRFDTKEIRLREPIMTPDCLIIQGVTLFRSMDVFQGLKSGGFLLVNSGKPVDELHIGPAAAKVAAKGHARIVAASELAALWRRPKRGE